jgi:hypothetical protein
MRILTSPYSISAHNFSDLQQAMVDEVLTQLSRQFDTMYARVGRPSIAPEKLLRAQLLQMLYCDPQQALVDGRDGLQPVVLLVCGAERG